MKKPNRLAQEKSPYLLQHAYNPINWYPWSEEAFKKAEIENKPVFISIGYSTCHWCHVMEKESFENENVAQLLNDSFVAIKVDREERPDIDHIYMKACQLFTGQGGWPLSLFLTPGKKPFFAGTYFPKESNYGRTGFIDLLKKIIVVWNKKQNDLLNSADEITGALLDTNSGVQEQDINHDTLQRAFNYFESNYDASNGGFGSYPKFPSPHNLMFLLRFGTEFHNQNAIEMAAKTLTEMRKGGIYDQLGFGFHRYSTDSKWLVPHFEKMLYDQALLLVAYCRAFLITGNDFFKATVYEIFEFLNTNLLAPGGAFFTAEDADSDGVEGIYYFWHYDEIYNILDKYDADLFCKTFNVLPDGNYKDEHTQTYNKNNILHLTQNLVDTSSALGIEYETFIKSINRSKSTLLAYRTKRIHPFKDNKVLADWNGLIIAGLAIAGRTFNDRRFIISAEKCFNYLSNNLIENNVLFHTFGKEDALIDTNIDDYAFLIWGIIELFRSTFNNEYILLAVKLADTAIDKFLDTSNGGFYFSADSKSDLIVRSKELYDGAIPSGNSVMIGNLIIISEITSEYKYAEYSNKMIKSFSKQINDHPHIYTFALNSFLDLSQPNSVLIISGDPNSSENKNIIKRLNSINTSKVLVIFNDTAKHPIFDYLGKYSAINNQTTFYFCKNFKCELPTTNFEDIIKQIV